MTEVFWGIEDGVPHSSLGDREVSKGLNCGTGAVFSVRPKMKYSFKVIKVIFFSVEL